MASNTDIDESTGDAAELQPAVDRFLAAVAGAEEAGDDEPTGGRGARRVRARLAEDLARDGGTLTAVGPTVRVGGRAVVGLSRRRPSGHEARMSLLAEEVEGAWRVVGATGDQAFARAFLLRWVDADTRYIDLPESIDGAAWVTRLVGALSGGRRPADALAAATSDAAPEVIAGAARRLEAALRRGGHTPSVAALGARTLAATGRVAAGLAVQARDGDATSVWLFVEPSVARDGVTRWRLAGSAGGPTLRGLVAGEALDEAFAGLAAAPRAPVADALDAALEGASAPALGLAGVDPRWLKLLSGLARSLSGPPPTRSALSDRALDEGETPEDRGVAIVAELLRAAVVQGRSE